MSVEEQREFYQGEQEVTSDPLGLIDRDNRNHRKKAELVMDATAAKPGDEILEVGCGHGLHAKHYAERFEYAGVDISESLVAETRAAIPSGAVIEANALDLPFADDYFDSVLGGAILHHIHDPAAALREWCRVARKDVALIEPNYLFPKDLLTAHVVPEEKHKTMMAPWRLRRLLDGLPGEASIEPHIYTPPWPASLHDAFDTLDEAARLVPGLRWASQMLLIQIHVSR